MPLVRFAVRNEYGLGVPELYKDAVVAEDPKAVLDGVSVAGLVGILRQLGDLAEFAAEVFHGLQEQVASTASRSRKLGSRVQRIEGSLHQLEKAILSQTSHIHFAYTPGTEWHPRIRNEKNHFIYDDLPHFIMDCYEECREPPRLQLLDRFDAGGPGSCLKRYSDPTFFRRASVSSEVASGEKSQHEKKARKSKRRRSSQWSGRFPNYTQTFSGRMHLPSTGQRQSLLSHTGSTFDMSFKSAEEDQSDSLCSKDGTDFIECVFHPSTSMPMNNTETMGSPAGRGGKILDTNGSIYDDEQTVVAGTCSPVIRTTVPHSSSTTWDEKMEIHEPMDTDYRIDDIQEVPKTNFDPDEHYSEPINAESINQVDDLSEYGSTPRSIVSEHGPEATIGDMQGVSNTNFDFDESLMRGVDLKKANQEDDLSEHGSIPESNVDGHYPETIINRNFMEPTGLGCVIDEVQDVLQRNFESHDYSLEPANMECLTEGSNFSEGEKTVESVAEGKLLNGRTDSKLDRGEVQFVLETNSDVAEEDVEAMHTEHGSQVEAFSEGENKVTVIEWPQFDDGESETDNFVDALNTIDSESESDYEGHTRRVAEICATPKSEMEYHTTLNDHKAEMISDQESEDERPSVRSDHEEQITDALQNSQALVPSTGIESLEYAQPSSNKSAEEDQRLDDVACLLDSSQHSSTLSLENAQSYCNELAVVQGEKPDDSTCLFDDQFVQSSKPSSTSTQSLELFQSSFNNSSLEPRNLDDSPCLFDDSQLPTASFSSATVVSLEPSQSPRNELAVRQGQKLDDSTYLLDEQPVPSNKSSSADFESPEHTGLSSSDSTQRSSPSVSSATIVSREHAESSSELAAVQGQKLDNSTCLIDEQLVECPTSSCSPNVSEGIDFPDHKPAVCENAASTSQALPNEGTRHTSHIPQEMPVGIPGTTPLAFWTNGNLLGLAPSKPTVFGVSSSVDSGPMNSGNDIAVGQFNPNNVQKVNRPAGTQASSLNDSECSLSTKEAEINIGDQDFGSPKNKSDQVSDEKHGRSIDQDTNNLTDYSLIQGLTNGHVTSHETKVPGSAGVKNVSSEVTNKSEDSSSLLSFIGRGLLKNSLRRTASLGYDEIPKTNIPSSNKSVNRCNSSVSLEAPETNLKRELNSSENSPPPSPPLEHMKISFRPIDGFESSRLKLKYPEGVDHHESTMDIFPSFQLVPEPSNLKHDIGSDSDDDTFCRSYACMSDDVNNHLSDSNSEEWDSEDSSGSNNRGIYEGFGRMGSTESPSSSPHCEEASLGSMQVGSRPINGGNLESSSSFDLPVLDTKNPFSLQEMKLCLHEVDSSHFQAQIPQTPQTPPLPPMQWRVSRPLFDAAEINQDLRPGGLNRSFDPKFSGSSNPNPAMAVQAEVLSRSEDSASIRKTEKLDDQKLEYQQQNCQAENGRKADEKGDLLQQIRAKSFNLRRTERSQSACVPSAAGSNKVTAILQKANAIRKAVASDDGEDDSWSDT